MNLFNNEVIGKPYELLLPLALILIFAKILAILCKKIKLPQVIGYLVSGLLLGLIYFIPNQNIFNDYTSNGISILAEIGVLLIMFTAGAETNLKQIKSVGKVSILITLLGVIIPFSLGVAVAYIFMPDNDLYSNLFYGVLLTATSVSITVAVLKELHKLDSKVGSSIIASAIIDDIIGMILLSLIISLSGGNNEGMQYVDNAALNTFIMILIMISYFLVAFIGGILIRYLFRFLDKHWAGHRRIPIFSLAICFLYAYFAEKFFNVADITGAYVAGLIISTTHNKEYVDNRIEGQSNIFFAPIFFASIALKMFSGENLISFSDPLFIGFGITFIFAGLIGKVLGAGIGAKISGFKFKDSLKVGIGMMARAEVVIVCAQKGIENNLIKGDIMPFILILIVISSLLTPIFLKLLYKKEINDNLIENRN